jgi:hypothetical protein
MTIVPSRSASCPVCATAWVKQACARSGVVLTALARRRLIAALLSHRHLILSGPAGIEKERLIQALAQAVTQGRQSNIQEIQGHPWWAAGTGDVARFVNMQTEFSVWRFLEFVGSALDRDVRVPPHEYVACIQRMSPVEVSIYFDKFLGWLEGTARSRKASHSLRLFGTYDGSMPPVLDGRERPLFALVHLARVEQPDAA